MNDSNKNPAMNPDPEPADRALPCRMCGSLPGNQLGVGLFTCPNGHFTGWHSITEWNRLNHSSTNPALTAAESATGQEKKQSLKVDVIENPRTAEIIKMTKFSDVIPALLKLENELKRAERSLFYYGLPWLD